MQLTTSASRPIEHKLESPKKSLRPHIYELDLIRTVTATLVITVHVLFFTKVFSTRRSFLLPHFALLNLTHVRAVFAFVTAFALVYVYAGKPFSGLTFWRKRSLGILLPYCFWSCMYVWFNWHPATPDAFVLTSLKSILLGDASYQLYFILLTLQFYILFPAFLAFIQKVKQYAWLVLGITFVLQMLVLYGDYHYIQPGGQLNLTGIWAQIAFYHDRYIFLYAAYFFMGGFAALYQAQVRTFLARHGKSIIALMLITTVLFIAYFCFQVLIRHQSYARATSFLQPVTGIYDAVLTIFICYGAYLLMSRKRADGKPHGYTIWQFLSNATFGVYLIHAFFISMAMDKLVPRLPAAWPAQVRVFIVWTMVVVCSYISSIILMKIPVVSRLVGRKQQLPALSTFWSTKVATKEA